MRNNHHSRYRKSENKENVYFKKYYRTPIFLFISEFWKRKKKVTFMLLSKLAFIEILLAFLLFVTALVQYPFVAWWTQTLNTHMRNVNHDGKFMLKTLRKYIYVCNKMKESVLLSTLLAIEGGREKSMWECVSVSHFHIRVKLNKWIKYIKVVLWINYWFFIPENPSFLPSLIHIQLPRCPNTKDIHFSKSILIWTFLIEMILLMNNFLSYFLFRKSITGTFFCVNWSFLLILGMFVKTQKRRAERGEEVRRGGEESVFLCIPRIKKYMHVHILWN